MSVKKDLISGQGTTAAAAVGIEDECERRTKSRADEKVRRFHELVPPGLPYDCFCRK